MKTWENHHCEKRNTQISPNLSHKLWKRLAPGMPGRSYQTKPGLPSGCQVSIKCFLALIIETSAVWPWCRRSFQDICRGLDDYSWAYLWLIFHDLLHGVPLMERPFPGVLQETFKVFQLWKPFRVRFFLKPLRFVIYVVWKTFISKSVGKLPDYKILATPVGVIPPPPHPRRGPSYIIRNLRTIYSYLYEAL
jgi:hypothetical protein